MIPIKYNVRSLAVRKTTTIATALGIALVVFVLASALMLSAGIKRTLTVGGQPDVAVVLRKGSDNELGSVIEVAAINSIMGASSRACPARASRSLPEAARRPCRPRAGSW